MYSEGRARIEYHSTAFLNPSAALSRDVSVAFVAAAAGRNTRILDATAATGIRGIRYVLETKAKNVTFLEMNRSAYKALVKNVSFNHIKANALNTSIQEFTNTGRKRFGVIDLDPFGGISPYIYDLMKVSENGTYLMATATDTAVLCGAHYKACVRLYDAVPMHNELCHEVGIRIMLGYIARMAAQFNFGIEPLLSLQHMHYMRVFVKLRAGAKEANAAMKSMGYAYYCNRCGNRYCKSGQMPESICKICGARLEVAGKLWSGNMHDKNTLGSMAEYLRGNQMQNGALELVEAIADEASIPLYYSVPKLTKRMGIGSVSPYALIDLLKKKGFSASKAQMQASCIRTNANIVELESAIKRIAKGSQP